jgi:hypothetical protein
MLYYKLYDDAKPADVSLNVLSQLPENHTYILHVNFVDL